MKTDSFACRDEKRSPPARAPLLFHKATSSGSMSNYLNFREDFLVKTRFSTSVLYRHLCVCRNTAQAPRHHEDKALQPLKPRASALAAFSHKPPPGGINHHDPMRPNGKEKHSVSSSSNSTKPHQTPPNPGKRHRKKFFSSTSLCLPQPHPIAISKTKNHRSSRFWRSNPCISFIPTS